ncbi:MAG: InlB B-repeat-containing protein, partial [Alphaproteobacteria bacterium]|nr:InlB B-repeat-containing protein [Alphaproteobacteria bacterium]
ANWHVHSYNIEFDANTGTGSKSNVVCEYNQNCDISNNEITKTGYRFVGWSENENGNNSPIYSPSSDNKIIVQNLTDEDNATVNLYAVWEIQNYNIRYEIGAARLSAHNPNTYNTTTPEFTLNNPELYGYQFKGWCLGDSSCNDPDTEYVFRGAENTGDKVFYAKFDAIVYTITYKDVAENGATHEISGLSPVQYTVQDNVVYPTNVPSAKHQSESGLEYEFTGWSTNSDLSDTTYGFTSGRTGDITLYANWNIVTPQGNVVYDCGNKRKITRTDYVGFNVSPASATECRIDADTLLAWTCNGVDYALDREITVANETINCVAKLKEPEPEVLETYTITYKDIAENGEENEITGLTPNTYTKQDSVTYPTQITYTHQGDARHTYEFTGWSTNSDLSDTAYGFTSGRTGNITLYANWNIVTPQGSVVYVCGNGRKITKTNYVGFDVPTATLSECRVSETSETTFDGWKCGDKLYAIGEEITVAETQTQCVTQWTTKHYNITYKDIAENGDESEITGLTPNTYTKQDSVTYPTQITYTHQGDARHTYEFAGWSTNSDLSDTTYGFTSGRTGDITLYANWNIVTPQGNVVYDCGNKRKITRTDYVGFNVLPATAEECRITLDTLIGWTCDGVDYATDEYMTVKAGTTTCVASIEMDEYNLIYNVNGGTWSDNSNVKTTYTRLDSFALSTDITKPNYDFVGWYLSPEFNNVITNIVSGTMHDTTVYANWTPKIVKCEPGYYLPSGTIICKECDERNKYCPGDYYEYSETNESGKEKCPDDYPFADMGAVSVDDCYTNCPNREHYTVSGNIKRYTNSCVYTPITYHINYVKNGGEFESGANVVYEYTVDSEFITSLPELKQTGKTFVGWFDANGTNITGIDTSLATDITLYARWVDTPCHEDYYKASDGSCVICPSHGYSDGGFTTSCSCDDGYYWNSETKECLYDYESECLSRGEDYRWDTNTQQCVYDGCPDGYRKITSTSSTFDVDVGLKGNSYISRSHDGQHCYGSASDSCEGNTLGNGEWETYFDYGVIKGIASCNNTPDSENADTSYMGVETSGQYCWCQINYFTPTGGNIESRISKWGYRYDRDDDASCKNHCASNCASYLRDKTSFRQKMYELQSGFICQVIDYTITYHLGGGNATNPSSYNVETPTWTLNNPTKENYDFIGWCETENCNNPALTYTIEQGTIGNKTLYAVWEKSAPTQFECATGKYLYVDENTVECKNCPIGYYCPHGVWTVETADDSKTPCPHGKTTENEGAGSESECRVVCPSGKYMRIGENESDKLCLYEEQQTHPALAIRVNGKTYYANMGQRNLTINAETTKKMRVEYMGRIYNVYDANME